MRKLLFALTSFFILLALFLPNTSPVLAAVNDFEIQDYQIDYYLDKDGAGRSTLKTVESITALFPTIDQNHGIERAIPNSYDGHSVNLTINSVTDSKGARQNYTTRTSGDNIVLRIGDANTYVHGLQNYKITYTQHDVTKFFKDTNKDEFYWDTNGTQWAVPVKALTARLHLGNGLRGALSNDQQCYFGPAGASSPCSITATNDGFTAKTTSLKRNENMTISVGFKPNTFVPYKATMFERLFGLWILSGIITFGLAIVLVIWMLIRYNRRSNRTAELSTIVPEYIPPKNASVSVSATITNKSTSVFSAQLIDFAVRHYIKIYQTREKSFWKSANYELEIIKDISDLKAEEQEVLRDLFGNPTVGTKLDMSTLKNNFTLSSRLSDNQKKLNNLIKNQYALRAQDPRQSAWFKRLAIITIIMSVLLVSPWLLVVSIIAFVCASKLKPLTDTGLELSRYLNGLKMYIKTAETERIRMLQSPDGAAKLDAPVDANDQRQLIKLYERVLPYAILFGQEKEWNNRLGQYYQSVNESPTWYSGNDGVFNAAVFSSAISNFSTAASYSDPSSSSSGGSGGGGSSGGGGGGGGGGGW